MSNLRRNWTPEEDIRVQELLTAGANNATVMRETGRSSESIRSRMIYLESRRRRAEAVPEIKPVGPPPEVYADAVKRANEPRTLTAWMCGDPPYSASALAKKRAVA